MALTTEKKYYYCPDCGVKDIDLQDLREKQKEPPAVIAKCKRCGHKGPTTDFQHGSPYTDRGINGDSL